MPASAVIPALSHARLFLFDIDGTLIVDGNSHFPSLIAGMSSVTGRPVDLRTDGDRMLLDGESVVGWVDHQLWSTVVEAAGMVFTPEVKARIGEVAVAHFTQMIGDGRYGGRLAPGAVELLTVLRAAGVAVGLATGNVRAIARAKMDAAGLSTWFDFPAGGGFGEHPDRAALAGAAAALVGVPASQVVLIGDTAGDVRAALANGFTPVGVSFGAESALALEQAGAVVVVDDLRDLVTG